MDTWTSDTRPKPPLSQAGLRIKKVEEFGESWAEHALRKEERYG